jgi:N-acetylmuramoyl-L-alanine amidase
LRLPESIKIICLLVATSLAATQVWAASLKSVRMHEAPDSTRVVFDTDAAITYEVFTLQNPHRVVVDLSGVTPRAGFDPAVVAVGRERVSKLRGAKRDADYRVVIDTKSALTPKAFTLKPIKPYGHRLVVDLFDPTVRPIKPPAALAKNRDVVVAIDAGHGGDDPGAIGPRRIQEKQVVLQIARKVQSRINKLPGFRGELIRTGDYYLPHRKRTQLARDKRADLFVSVHADAFKKSNVKGASVYTLSDRGATSETAAWLAQRENRADLLGGVGDVSLTDKDPVLAHVLLDLSMDANRSQSISAGESVLANLGRVTKLHKQRVEQAAFIVLKSPDMPSILVETGFISNPDEARRLAQAEHQNNLARAIANGIEQYMRDNPPPGTLLAANQNLPRDMRYTIVRGDTLSTIAMRYGVSSKILKAKNGLRNDNIKVGQIIVIPGA